MIDKRACVSGSKIGERTKVWQFASVIRGASIGADCTIASCSIVDAATLGDRCIVSHGASVHPGAWVGNDVFVGPGAVLCNDAWPRTHKRGFDASRPSVVVEDGASIGANATVLPGVRIGAGAMVAADTVVTRDVPARHLHGPGGSLVPISDEEDRCARRSMRGRGR